MHSWLLRYTTHHHGIPLGLLLFRAHQRVRPLTSLHCSLLGRCQVRTVCLEVLIELDLLRVLLRLVLFHKR